MLKVLMLVYFSHELDRDYKQNFKLNSTEHEISNMIFLALKLNTALIMLINVKMPTS